MKVATEAIRKMRDERVDDRHKIRFAPQPVQNRNETMISILNEILEYREAEEQSETLDLYGGTVISIPVRGTVS